MKRAGWLAAVTALVIAIVVALAWRPWRRRGNIAATTATSAPATGVRHAGPRTVDDRAAPTWLIPAHVPARRVAGRVTFAGAPVPDAEVRAVSVMSRLGVVDAPRVRTTADGAFDLGVLPPLGYDVIASLPGHTPALVHVELADPTARPAPDSLELILRSCDAALFGVVHDAVGGPIAHARVVARDAIATETGVDGTYDVCVARGALTELAFDADGYGGVVLATDGAGRVHRDVVLVPEGIVVGRVVRADDAQPVAAAIVRLWPDWGRERASSPQTITDGDGRFRLVGVTPGSYGAVASTARASTMRASVIDVRAGETTADVILRVDARARISGVVTSHGAPVAGVPLVAMRASPISRSPSAISQDDGSFTIDGGPDGAIDLVANGWQVVSPTKLAIAPGADVEHVEVVVERLATIRGRVTHRGAPVAGATVFSSSRATTIADSDGRYALLGVEAGTWNVSAQSADVGAFTSGVDVTIARGEQRDGVDLELDFDATISGVVVDQDGAPVEGVLVRTILPSTGDLGEAISDAHGGFRCTSMTGGGDYQPRVFARRGAPTPLAPADGSAALPAIAVPTASSQITGVTLAVRVVHGRIAGRVVDTTGAPVPDARVRALEATDGPPIFHSWLDVPATVTDADGGFAFEQLASGDYAVQARAPDGGEAIAPHVATGTRDVVLAVARPGSIDGTLVGYAAAPVVYARTIATGFHMVRAELDGARFTIGGLAPGRYLVTAMTTDFGDAATVEIAPGRATAVTLTSRGTGALDVTVTDFASHAPVVGARCHVVVRVSDEGGLTDWDPSTLPATDARGQVHLDRAPAGDVRIHCGSPSWRISDAIVDTTVPRGGAIAVAALVATRDADTTPGSVGLELDFESPRAPVVRIVPGGPAAKAGVQPGDLVVRVDGLDVSRLSAPAVAYVIATKPPGTTVALGLARGARVIDVRLVVGPPGN